MAHVAAGALRVVGQGGDDGCADAGFRGVLRGDDASAGPFVAAGGFGMLRGGHVVGPYILAATSSLTVQ